MTRAIFLLISVLLSMPLFSQHDVGKDGVNMNSCDGAVNIFETGQFSMDFNGGSDQVHLSYPSLESIDSKNTLWCSYIAPKSGTLEIEAGVRSGYLQMVIFQQQRDDICGEIKSGIAEMKRVMLSKQNKSVGLRTDVDSAHLYSLHLDQDQKIYVLFSTDAKEEKKLALNWTFDEDQYAPAEKRIVDRRDDDFAPTLTFSVRDCESGLPLIAGLVIEGHRDLQGMYTGSDFHFSISGNSDLTISCDLEGYFFHDSIYEISANEDQEVYIILDPVSSGKSLHIEEIQFVPGTSEILKSSEPKLRRLKDFLALNSELEIEIQGHVFAMGDNSYAAQKVSEARAKRVMKYLTDNGIDRKRLTAVGYGNTRPIYEDPIRSHQEQANRRIEILVK